MNRVLIIVSAVAKNKIMVQFYYQTSFHWANVENIWKPFWVSDLQRTFVVPLNVIRILKLLGILETVLIEIVHCSHSIKYKLCCCWYFFPSTTSPLSPQFLIGSSTEKRALLVSHQTLLITLFPAVAAVYMSVLL